ncbi:MAG: hypothetical protein KF799_15240 [Bdellovibrionales bacterium]|nr:hypothetical protein [Bdellovibrionales bacterium]
MDSLTNDSVINQKCSEMQAEIERIAQKYGIAPEEAERKISELVASFRREIEEGHEAIKERHHEIELKDQFRQL